MATRALGADSALANPLQFMLPPGCTSVTPLLRLLSRFDRNKVEAFAEISIAMLDLIDGDPDLEEIGSEDDISDASTRRLGDYGPGCEIGDPGGQDSSEDEPGQGLGADDGFPGCPISDPGEYSHP